MKKLTTRLIAIVMIVCMLAGFSLPAQATELKTGIGVVMALYDADGNIIDIEDDDLYSGRALAPGSSMIFRKEIPSGIAEYLEKEGIVPASVDAIAYVNVDVE